MDVRFYDFEFNRLAEFPRFISWNYDKKYCGFGNVEIHFPIKETEVIELLEKNLFLFFEVESAFAVVTGWKIDDDIAVYARTPEWLLTKRGLMPIEYKNTLVTEIVSKVLCDAAGDMVMVKEMPEINVYADYSTDGLTTVYDVVCGVLEAQKLGFEVSVDLTEKQLLFSLISGSEKKLFISKDYRTAYDFVYTGDIQDMASSSGWYECRYEDMGDWNAAKNNPNLQNGKAENFYTCYRISNSYSGRFNLNCVEGEYLFCDNRQGMWKTTAEKPSTGFVYVENSDAIGLKRWDIVLSGIKTVNQGKKDIENKVRSQEVTAEVKQLEFGTDYKLGDTVCVQTEYGSIKKSEKKQVASVSLYRDTDKSGIIPVLRSLEE